MESDIVATLCNNIDLNEGAHMTFLYSMAFAPPIFMAAVAIYVGIAF